MTFLASQWLIKIFSAVLTTTRDEVLDFSPCEETDKEFKINEQRLYR